MPPVPGLHSCTRSASQCGVERLTPQGGNGQTASSTMVRPPNAEDMLAPPAVTVRQACLFPV
jgi:hypothetical protein